MNSNDSSLIKTPSSFFLGAIAPTVLHHNVINNDEIDWTHVSTDKSDILDLFGELEDQVINHANDFPSRPLEAPVEDQDSSDHIMASPEEDVSRHAECDQSISPGPCAFALQPVALFAPVHPPSLEIFELPLHPVNVEKSSDEMSICQGALSLDDAQSPEFPTDSLLVMSAKAWASRVLGAPSRVIEQILNKPLSIVAESTGSLFGNSLMYPTTQGDATTEAQCNMQIESTLAQPQTASDSGDSMSCH